MIVTQATIDAVTELIGDCFKMNRHLDRLVSVLGVEFAYNNTADLVHQGIAHYYPMLADSLGERCLERYNIPVYYAATPEGGQDYTSVTEIIKDLEKVNIEFQTKMMGLTKFMHFLGNIHWLRDTIPKVLIRDLWKICIKELLVRVLLL